jgi:cytochrome c553
MDDKRNHAVERLGAGAALALLLIAAASCAGSGKSTVTQTVEGTQEVCSSCHGFDGKSVSPTFPRLAGQQKEYLEVQLKAFRDKSRADPHAHTYMWGMAAKLSDSTIDGLAALYSAKPPAAGTPSSSPDVAAGQKIFAEGIPDAEVPPCAACHGEHAEGAGAVPRLAGQHRPYIEEQLTAFSSNARANEIMHENSKHLTEDQIREMAAFLATQ